jgi:hypothetical protein
VQAGECVRQDLVGQIGGQFNAIGGRAGERGDEQAGHGVREAQTIRSAQPVRVIGQTDEELRDYRLDAAVTGHRNGRAAADAVAAQAQHRTRDADDDDVAAVPPHKRIRPGRLVGDQLTWPDPALPPVLGNDEVPLAVHSDLNQIAIG